MGVGLNRRYATLLGLTLVAIWLWIARARLYKTDEHLSWNIISNHPAYEVVSIKNDLFDFPRLESEAMKEVCYDEIHWNKSMVFTCDESTGGVGHVRNSILHCVRYAIAAGASLVLPRIVQRNESDISDIQTGQMTKFDYMFDMQHFLDSLRLSCPGLEIHKSTSSINDYPKDQEQILLPPESVINLKHPENSNITLHKIPGTAFYNPRSWRKEFYNWLRDNYSDPSDPRGERKKTMIVSLGRSFLQYPIATDGPEWARDFGNVLKFRADIRVLATKIIRNLAFKYSLPQNLAAGIIPNAFFGVHLRTEKDAVEDWPPQDWAYSRYRTQSKLYLEQVPRSNSPVIYVASGDLSEVAKFALDVASSTTPLPVVTKFDLLSGIDLEELEALSWDQQALVDFLVLLKASDFAGVGHSSFAWNVALKRRIFSREEEYLEEPQMLSDELSQIYGPIKGYPEYVACLWP